MSQKSTTNLSSGLLLLAAGSALSALLWRRYRGAQPDKLLHQIKQEFDAQPITGSWIDFQPFRYHNRWAYRGGIRQQNREYRFIVAANGQHLAGHWQPLTH